MAKLSLFTNKTKLCHEQPAIGKPPNLLMAKTTLPEWGDFGSLLYAHMRLRYLLLNVIFVPQP